MSRRTNFSDIKKCTMCNNHIYVPCVELWAYKRIKHCRSRKDDNLYYYFCSWHCLQEFENKQKKKTDGRWATQR